MRETTGRRLNQIMSERNLKQVDILNLTKRFTHGNLKISKTDLSQYVNGKTEPRPDKLFILAKALEVNEAWLMGYDSRKERTPGKKTTMLESRSDSIPKTEQQLGLTDDEIMTLAAHRVGYEGNLTDEEIKQVKNALRIALEKD
ncbi:Helix-turn-helix domain-containing protein [Amphibacillus marinus]|uniref:Helix-turn-helix domain-containing protein n=1 Tax=Amphibacillus marinus TaxID=872970 RepID=A0A1H8IYK8_9BACI|nr:helix-turn-helix domain-containing protein [Amphibacillus marinus]SEN73840.1 Helix-turn-helix domain-containing protein [Amphibacillus marinus]